MSAAKCWCNVFAIAECSTCNSPLCGDHILRFGRRVFCELHLAAEKAHQRDREAHAFLEEVGSIAVSITDLTERCLCVGASMQHAPTYIKYPDFGEKVAYGKPPTDVQSERRERRRASLLSKISDMIPDPGPFFRVVPETAGIALVSSDQFYAWVFGHPKAERLTIRVTKWTPLIKRYRQVDSIEAVRLTPDTSDNQGQHPTTIPGMVLMADGKIGPSSDVLISRGRTSQWRGSGATGPSGLEMFARALRIPYVRKS